MFGIVRRSSRNAAPAGHPGLVLAPNHPWLPPCDSCFFSSRSTHLFPQTTWEACFLQAPPSACGNELARESTAAPFASKLAPCTTALVGAASPSGLCQSHVAA